MRFDEQFENAVILTGSLSSTDVLLGIYVYTSDIIAIQYCLCVDISMIGLVFFGLVLKYVSKWYSTSSQGLCACVVLAIKTSKQRFLCNARTSCGLYIHYGEVRSALCVSSEEVL